MNTSSIFSNIYFILIETKYKCIICLHTFRTWVLCMSSKSSKNIITIVFIRDIVGDIPSTLLWNTLIVSLSLDALNNKDNFIFFELSKFFIPVLISSI